MKTSRNVATGDSLTALPLIVTDAGREAAIAANDAGLQLQITEVAIGSGQWTPDATAAGLQNEIKRLDNIGGAASGPAMIHLSFTDAGADEYTVGEFGLYTDSGILFAIFSRSGGWIAEKTADSILMLSADMVLDTVPPDSVTVTGNNFVYPPATPTLQGVMYDAPNAKQYARSVGQWQEVKPVDETTPEAPGTIIDAPYDDVAYCRKNGNWIKYQPFLPLPIGAIIAWPGKSAPAGWLTIEPTTVYQKSDYPALYDHLKKECPHLIIDANTFKLAEARGAFIRGYDPTGVNDPDGVGRELMTAQGDAAKYSRITEMQPTGSALNAVIPIPENDWSRGIQVDGHSVSGNWGPRFRGQIQGKENRPKNLNALWIIKAYDTIADPELLQAKSVIDQVNNNSGRIQVLENLPVDYQLIDFGTVNKATRYVKPNPFGNSKPVIVVAEINVSGHWAGTGFVENGGGNGVNGYYVEGEGIIVRTGNRGVYGGHPQSYGSGHNTVNTGVIHSAPCRVHVWRVGV